MPRPPRDKTAGTFHVYTHSVWGYPALFADDQDRLEFIRHLARVSQRDGWTCVGFCLMSNHHHLIVAVDGDVLPIAMRDLNYAYACAFNGRHGLRGHVHFNRYGARRIHNTDDLLGLYAYVMNNPADAGHSATAEEWLWSSHAGTIGVRAAHSFVDASPVLGAFEFAQDTPRAALRRFVNLCRKPNGGAQAA